MEKLEAGRWSLIATTAFLCLVLLATTPLEFGRGCQGEHCGNWADCRLGALKN